METFNLIVSIAVGVSAIIALILTLFKGIKLLNKKMAEIKERDGKIQQSFSDIHEEIKNTRDDIKQIRDDLKEDIERVRTEAREESEESKAIMARTQILRFADEVYNGVKHTKEHFDQILEAGKKYNNYCETHPDFENDQTVIAQEKIRSIYRKCLDEHSFLNSKEEDNENQ